MSRFTIGVVVRVQICCKLSHNRIRQQKFVFSSLSNNIRPTSPYTLARDREKRRLPRNNSYIWKSVKKSANILLWTYNKISVSKHVVISYTNKTAYYYSQYIFLPHYVYMSTTYYLCFVNCCSSIEFIVNVTLLSIFICCRRS